jgi:hypothetical protein
LASFLFDSVKSAMSIHGGRVEKMLNTVKTRTLSFTRTTPFQAWVVHTVIVLTAAAVAVLASPERDSARPPSTGLDRLFVTPLSLWDGAWYQRIAADGYADRNAAAFWPLFPLLIRSMSELFRIPLDLAGVVLSNGFFLVALWALHRLVSQSYEKDIARRTVWLIALCPFSFFFSAVYTESLFFLLMVIAVLFARESRWTLAAFALLLVTLTRSSGVLVAIPMIIAALQQYGWDVRRLVRPAAQIAAACLGPLVFSRHLDRRWDDPLLMVHAQEHWSRVFSWPWNTLWNGFRRSELIYINARHTCLDLASGGTWASCRDALGVNIDSLNDDLATFSLLIAFGLLILAGRRLITGDLALVAALMIFPLFTSLTDDPFGSMPRYLLVTYPLAICAAFLLPHRRMFIAVLVVGGGGCFWLTTVFARAWFVA